MDMKWFSIQKKIGGWLSHLLWIILGASPTKAIPEVPGLTFKIPSMGCWATGNPKQSLPLEDMRTRKCLGWWVGHLIKPGWSVLSIQDGKSNQVKCQTDHLVGWNRDMNVGMCGMDTVGPKEFPNLTVHAQIPSMRGSGWFEDGFGMGLVWTCMTANGDWCFPIAPFTDALWGLLLR